MALANKRLQICFYKDIDTVFYVSLFAADNAAIILSTIVKLIKLKLFSILDLKG